MTRFHPSETKGYIRDSVTGEAINTGELPDVLIHAMCDALNVSPYAHDNALGLHPVVTGWHERVLLVAYCPSLPDAPKVLPYFAGGVRPVEVWNEETARAFARRVCAMPVSERRDYVGGITPAHVGDTISDMFPPGCEPETLDLWMEAAEDETRIVQNKKTKLEQEWEDLEDQARERIPDRAKAVVLMRLGDFYETFHDQARALAKVCSIALTKRCEIPMSGVPLHSLSLYANMLIAAGYYVVVCDYKNGLMPKAGDKKIPPRIITAILLPRVQKRVVRYRAR